MRKLLTGILALGLMVGMIWGADVTTSTWGNSAVLTTGSTGKAFTNVVEDTFTVHVEDGTKTIKFNRPVYNIVITSINPATDSSYVNITPRSGFFGIEYVNSVMQAYNVFKCGNDAEADTLMIWMGITELDLDGVVGGTADSTTLVHLKGVR